MKRTQNFVPKFESTPKTPKFTGISNRQYSIQTIGSTGTPITSFDGKVLLSGGTDVKPTIIRNNSGIKIKPGTAVKIDASQIPFIQNGALATTNTTNTVRRPTIFIKNPRITLPKRTIRTITLEMIEKNPYFHLGVTGDRLQLIQNIICPTVNVMKIDLYIVLKKLRLNEEFAILSEYFEYSELEIQRIFIKTLLRLAKCMRFLVRWPESQKYYDRHKNLPITFRTKLSFVQSLIECVETEVKNPPYPQSIEQLECKNFKYILTITPTGVISFVSDVFCGTNQDDLGIFDACNFRNIIPSYLSLVADPGKAIRKKSPGGNESKIVLPDDDGHTSDGSTDSADETGESSAKKQDKKNKKPKSKKDTEPKPINSKLNIVDKELTSKAVKDFTIPTVRIREETCRLQIQYLIDLLREFKILQPYAVVEPQLFQFINEILLVTSGLINLQR